MAETGFKIGDETYPFSGSLTLGDIRLIERVTGLHFTEFAKRQDAALESVKDGAPADTFDAIVMVGLVAVSVAQGHPEWSPAEVEKFVNAIRFEDLTSVGGDDVPPALAAIQDSPGAPDISPNTPEQPATPEAA